MVGDSGYNSWGSKANVGDRRCKVLDKWFKGWRDSARVRSKYARWGQMVKVGGRVVTEQEMGRDRARKGWQQSKKKLRQRFEGLVKCGRCGHMVQG